MKCPVCNLYLKEFEGLSKYLLAVKEEKGDIHIHGDLDNKELVHEFCSEISHRTHTSFNDLNLKEIIFHNRQRIGDILMFTCAVRDFKKAFPKVKVNVISTAMHLWDNNPNIDSTLVPYYKNGKTLKDITVEDLLKGDTNVLKIGPGWLTNASNRIDWHFSNAYRVSMEQALGVHIPQGESRPDIWLSDEEFNAPRLIADPYWIICIGGERGWGCKMYPFERWQAFVNQNPDVKFVQIGSQGDCHQKLQGPNIIDMIGKTEDKDKGVRDLFKLFLNAEGSIGLVSFHMHLSGGLTKPSIVVAGAREPVSFTRYAGHQYLATDGCLPCSITACWHCNIATCTNLIRDINLDKELLDKVIAEKPLSVDERKLFDAATKNWVPKCVDMIQPEDLTKALNNYYVGGRLQKGVASSKPKFKNIVKVTPKQPEVVAQPEIKETPVNPQFNMAWGGTSIYEEDWLFLKKIIDDYNVKSIVEFGAGLSTLIFNEMGFKVTTYENSPEWIEQVKKMNPKCDIRLWDGVTCDVEGTYDLVFVDGPRAYGKHILGRQHSIEKASKIGNIVVLHDATRPGEALWAKSHLTNFSLKHIGGKWDYVHCYVHNNVQNDTQICTKITTPFRDWKSFKIISTARGWGGCGRSITTIMKFLVKSGHKVEFIPFRSKVSSAEFLQFFKENPQIKVTEGYHTIKEECDNVFIYADDYVWEFVKPEIADIFSTLNAKKKIMMVNYRRGKIGEEAWTRNWDKYMFLNSSQEKDFLKVHPGVPTKVLPPCTELDDFLKFNADYSNGIRIVRHSSQGDTKFDKSIENEISQMLDRPEVKIDMLPGPSFLNTTERFRKHGRTAVNNVIGQFLSTGNLFWYSLPKGYMDMGPRVVLEAMAVGLPILADNWGGVADRVTPECGWLCDTKEQMIEIVKNVTPEELERKGKAAKERALKEFIPEKWIGEIV